MNNFLFKIFSALDKAEIRYCLLRGLDELNIKAANKEIDLLVDPDNLPLFAKTIAMYGFVPLPSWGYAPHHFFVAYDAVNDIWLKLDVVTDLIYGKPIRCLRIDLARNCVSRRRRHEPTYILSLDDEFITLLLHCLLDKGEIRTEHRARLKFLLNETSNDFTINQRIVRYIKRFLPTTINWNMVIQAIDEEDWSSLLNHRTAMVHKLFWRNPIMNTWRSIRSRLLRRFRPLLFILRRHGILIAILAPDGAGKSTLAKNLTQDDHMRARLIYMGTNTEASNIGLPATRWLKEQVKSLHEHKLSLKRKVLKGLNFSNRLMEQWYRYGVGLYHKLLGRFVVFDRYVYDSYLAPRESTFGKRFRRWLLKSTCPAPDLVFLLDAPGTTLYQRKREHTPERLERQRQIFLGLKDKISNMIVVDATRNANEVRREVTSMIWKYYGDRELWKKINGSN